MTGKSSRKKIRKTLLLYDMLTMNLYHAYISKHNLMCEKQAILLMIQDKENWHYIAVKKRSLLREITYKHNDDFYYINYLYLLRTKNKL